MNTMIVAAESTTTIPSFIGIPVLVMFVVFFFLMKSTRKTIKFLFKGAAIIGFVSFLIALAVLF